MSETLSEIVKGLVDAHGNALQARMVTTDSGTDERANVPYPFASLPSIADPADRRFPCRDCGMIHLGAKRECYPGAQTGGYVG